MLLCMCVSMYGMCTCVLVNCECPSLKTVYLVFPADFCQWPGDYQVGQVVWPAALGIHLPLSPALELQIHATISSSTKKLGCFSPLDCLFPSPPWCQNSRQFGI